MKNLFSASFGFLGAHDVFDGGFVVSRYLSFIFLKSIFNSNGTTITMKIY